MPSAAAVCPREAQLHKHLPEIGSDDPSGECANEADLPRKSDWTGCLSIAWKMPLNATYRTNEMIVKVMNKSTFRAKSTTDIQYNHRALYGRLWSRIETIPVPMITENQLARCQICELGRHSDGLTMA